MLGVVLLVFVAGAVVTYGWVHTANHGSIRTALVRAWVAMKSAIFLRADARAYSWAAQRAREDDWYTFAHDDRRSGFQAHPGDLSRSTVSKLQLRWLRSLHESIYASALAVRGLVYVVTLSGKVYALSAGDGTTVWVRDIGGPVRMTPALVDNTLFIGVYGALGDPGVQPHGAAFLALDASTGNVLWRTPLPGLVRSEPVVLHGIVYEGLAGGDSFSGCFNGGIVALDAGTGVLRGERWQTTPRQNDGGGIFGPLSTDGTTIYVGTGNTCSGGGGNGYGQSVVALTPTLNLRWHLPTMMPGGSDADVGGGVVLDEATPQAHVLSKHGFYYVIDRITGKAISHRDLHPWGPDAGSVMTPTGDGEIRLLNAGERVQGTRTEDAHTEYFGIDRNGKTAYRFASNTAYYGAAAFVRGVGFLPLARELVAFDAESGERLWSAALADFSYASPIVVPSGVYEATLSGDVFAFGLPHE
jgi:outer membrane protein assembly factor BamB